MLILVIPIMLAFSAMSVEYFFLGSPSERGAQKVYQLFSAKSVTTIRRNPGKGGKRQVEQRNRGQQCFYQIHSCPLPKIVPKMGHREQLPQN